MVCEERLTLMQISYTNSYYEPSMRWSCCIYILGKFVSSQNGCGSPDGRWFSSALPVQFTSITKMLIANLPKQVPTLRHPLEWNWYHRIKMDQNAAWFAIRKHQNLSVLMWCVKHGKKTCHVILLMEEILHKLIGSLSQYLQGLLHPRWCRNPSIDSTITYHL